MPSDRDRGTIMAVNIGKVALHESAATGKQLVVIRPVDSISPQLRAALHGNALLPAVQAQLVPAVQHGLLLPAVQSPAAPGDTVVLRNVKILSIAPAPSWAGGAPQESVTFEYGALTVTAPAGGETLSRRRLR
jgi:type VI protein secretion system component Hcp